MRAKKCEFFRSNPIFLAKDMPILVQIPHFIDDIDANSTNFLSRDCYGKTEG